MSFSFVDLFSGIGGFHIAAHKLGGICIQACDINKVAREIYWSNFKILPHDDIYTIPSPKQRVDLVTFGNPCQPYSSCGQRKGLDDDRGKLVYEVVKYLQGTNATCFIMENVYGLVTVNQGLDFKKILNMFRRLGYKLAVFTLNAQDFNIPQHRVRVYVVGHKTVDFNPGMIPTKRKKFVMNDLLDTNADLSKLKSTHFNNVPLTLTPVITKSNFHLRAKINNYTQNKLFSSYGDVGTVLARWSPVIYDERNSLVRELSQRELLNLQGFPKSYKWPQTISRRDTIRCIGNSVCVPVIYAIIKAMLQQGLIQCRVMQITP